MKALGIVRRVDQLGRIVIPKELRSIMSITENETELEIFTEANGQIIMQKYEPGCAFCGEMADLKKVGNKLICPECMKKMVENCA